MATSIIARRLCSVAGSAVIGLGLLAGGTSAAAALDEATAGTTTIRPATIESGARTRVPHVQGTTVYHRGVELRLRAEYVHVHGLAADGRYVITALGLNGRPGWRTVLMSAEYDTELVTRGPAGASAVLSADGSRLLMYRYTHRWSDTLVWVKDLASGRTIAQKELTGIVTPLGAARGQAVLTDVGRDRRTVRWVFGRERTRLVDRRTAYLVDYRAGRIAFWTGDPYDGGCSVLARLADPGVRLWRSCRERVAAVAPNGGRIAAVHKLSDGVGHGQVSLRRGNGRLLGRYVAPGWFGRLVFERSGALLLDTNGKDRRALVRVADGELTLATPLTRRETP